MNEQEKQPRLLAMMGLVALVVALVILVVFGIGYLFGRAYLLAERRIRGFDGQSVGSGSLSRAFM